MTRRFSADRLTGRLAAWALLLIVVMIVWSVLFEPLHASAERAARDHARARANFDRVSALVAAREHYAAELSRTEARAGELDAYLSGARYDLAAARLQGLLLEELERFGADISRSTILDEQDEDPARVRLRLQFTADYDALIDWLIDLRSAEPVRIIDSLSIANRRNRFRDADAENLQIDAEISGFRRLGAEASTEERL